MRRLVYRMAARRDMVSIFEYITRESGSIVTGRRFIGLLRQQCAKLAALPRNSAQVRVRNRCELSGRPRAYYRKFKLSRIALRELASTGQIPGMVKSSW